MSRTISKEAVRRSYSKEMDDIIGKPPHWLISWGSVLLLAVFLMATAVSYLIPYPESITTGIRFFYSDTTITTVAENKLSIKKMWLSNGSFVNAGDTLLTTEAEDSTFCRSLVYITALRDGKITFPFSLLPGSRIPKDKNLFSLICTTTHPVAQFLFPVNKAKKLNKSQKIIINPMDPSFPDPERITGKLLGLSESKEVGFSYVMVSLSGELHNEALKTMLQRKETTVSASVTFGTVPLLFIMFQKKSP